MKNKMNRSSANIAASFANAVPSNATHESSTSMKSAQADMQTKQTALQDALNHVNTPIQTTKEVGNTPTTDYTAQQEVLQKEVQQQSQPQTSAEQLQQELESAQQSTSAQSNPGATQVSYTDPNGQQQIGYIIDGVTYTDADGTTQVPAGSTVTDAYGRQWYKGDDGSSHVNGNGDATTVTYTDTNGVEHTGYLIGGVTYTDTTGTTEIPVGSIVTTPDGTHWYKGDSGSFQLSELEYQRQLSDLSYLINQQFDAADNAIKTEVNKATQDAVDQLNRAMQDAQPSYEAAIANQLLETKQAQDAQALRNQVNGDRGGIGSAQVDSIVNTGAKNREEIATQQRQLATDTARQIADLRAQGKYQEATNLLQNAQQRLSALYNEQVRLQQVDSEKKTQLASLGSTFMNAGLMPTDEMLAALGIDRATAQMYLDAKFGTENGSSSGSGSGSGSFEFGDGMNGNEFRWLQMTIDTANIQENEKAINNAMEYANGKISESQYEYLCDVYGWDKP